MLARELARNKYVTFVGELGVSCYQLTTCYRSERHDKNRVTFFEM